MTLWLSELMVVLMILSGSIPLVVPVHAAALHKTDAEWQKVLTPQQYHVLRKHGTERPFSGQYDHFYKNGTYVCAGCGHALFKADAKFNSQTGWPSFFKPLAKNAVATQNDGNRTEVHCLRCGGHLGHVFTDGPKPTGLRYCMNSVALKFIPVQAHAKRP